MVADGERTLKLQDVRIVDQSLELWFVVITAETVVESSVQNALGDR